MKTYLYPEQRLGLIRKICNNTKNIPKNAVEYKNRMLYILGICGTTELYVNIEGSAYLAVAQARTKIKGLLDLNSSPELEEAVGLLNAALEKLSIDDHD